MTLHPQAVSMLEQLAREDGPSVLDDVAAVRAQARAAALAVPDRIGLETVADVDADGVPCRLYSPRVGAPVALYVHGGGWVLHDLETHDVFCRYLAHETGWALLAVDYRRAPEHPYPAPLDDVETAARWLRGHAPALRVTADLVPGIGDSSGANLVAGLLVRDPTLLGLQVLMYPPTDAHAALHADEANAALDGGAMDWFWHAYAPGDDADRPDVSVLHAGNLAEHPPAVVVTAEHDVLRDQGEAYAAALAAAGVEVDAHRALGMIHSFWRLPGHFDASRATVRSVGATLDAYRARLR